MDRVNEFLSQNKIPIALSFVGLVLIIGGMFSSGLTKSTPAKLTIPKESLVKSEDLSQLEVDVSGAVNNPGVYSLPTDAPIEDAIKIANGFAPKANQEYISKSVNLSQKVSDGQKIYIPFAGESGVVLSAAIGNSSSTSSLIGVNSASADQLDSLPGVGPVTAQKIISSRPFGSLEELTTKKAVSKSVFDKIKDQIDLD